ncbi:multidrug ABC transporter substrate-binding protein [Malaciobacter canalis]|uniref:Multidrug ABC transporter substrate-binding protein n=1 Tax=Malaciobacter canalis TaxID=1912871 RepID=A0ABX4LWA5_9BACT|nr:ABC transporter permease [Malaciobacter canalis]PHO10613.1 multidrug ABC transporter substrate-binding protein [Malaciobacter canalis]QEE32061.1 ABC transporter, permease protein, MacB family [Malaciobacter canalis]
MLLNAFLIALKEIKRNILRSILTILGIVIGVTSVIAMVMIGDGTTANVQENISKLGTNMLTLRVGQERRGKPRSDNSARAFKQVDIDAIKNQIVNIKAIAAENSSLVNAIYSNKSYTTSIIGTSNDYFVIKDWILKSGRAFDENELNFGQTSCILGTTIVKQLFDNQDPLGAKVRLNSFACTVIGVLKSKGAAAFGRDQDEIIVVPLKMFQRKIQGNKDIKSILISINESKNIKQAKKDITLLMQERRAIKKSEENNFYIRDMQDLLSTMTSTTKMLTYLLGSIAAISLLVGGIGIMNIMLVSVTERTREIGTRLAIGAMESEVLLQFLVESIVLSTLGGIIGIVLGISIGYFAVHFMELPFIINTQIIIIAFIFSTLIGVIFGYFPARKAARLNPIDALRYE